MHFLNGGDKNQVLAVIPKQEKEQVTAINRNETYWVITDLVGLFPRVPSLRRG